MNAQSRQSPSLSFNIGGRTNKSMAAKPGFEPNFMMLLLRLCTAAAEYVRNIWRRSRADGCRDLTRIRQHI